MASRQNLHAAKRRLKRIRARAVARSEMNDCLKEARCTSCRHISFVEQFLQETAILSQRAGPMEIEQYDTLSASRDEHLHGHQAIHRPPNTVGASMTRNAPSPKMRTVGTMGPNVYLDLRPGVCWRCGYGNHDRAKCTEKSVLFCSRCGLMGVMTRNCSCHPHKKRTAVQCDLEEESLSKRQRTQHSPRREPRRARIPTRRKQAHCACPRCREH